MKFCSIITRLTARCPFRDYRYSYSTLVARGLTCPTNRLYSIKSDQKLALTQLLPHSDGTQYINTHNDQLYILRYADVYICGVTRANTS